MPKSRPEILHQIDDPGLHRHVERRGRLVEDQECGLRHQRHRDDDALLLAARELVRIAPEDAGRVRQPHRIHHLQRPRPRLGLAGAGMDHRHFHQLPPDLHRRVQARHRLLVDHRDLRAADLAQLRLRHRRQVPPLEADRPADDPPRLAEIAHHPQRHRRLAAAALADQPQRLARLDAGRKVHHRRDLAGAGEEADREVVDLEDRLGHRINPSSSARAARPRAGSAPAPGS